MGSRRVEALLMKMVTRLESIDSKPAGDVTVVNNAQGAALKSTVYTPAGRPR